jgi:anti-sigma regulatory factor (Ser/Thr protein kinase)
VTRLHFQPIEGKSLDILDTILKNTEVVSVDDSWRNLSVVVEEIVLNIVDYSKSDYLDVEIIRDEENITLRFHDGGVPFNPVEKEMPDFAVPMENRQIGGLGIFMVIKYMDTVRYDRSGDENILTVMKRIRGK